MSGLSVSRFSLLFGFVILCQGLGNAEELEDVLSSDTHQLWQSFQEELKTLEQAAHRVNTLLVSAAHSKTDKDQEAKPAENAEQVVSADKREDEVTAVKSEEEEDDMEENVDEVDSLLGGLRPPHSSRPINIGSLFGFFRNMPEPWWRGKNVCVVKTEKVEDKNNTSTELDPHVLIMGIGTFEHCKQSSSKYVCTTVTSSGKSSKSVSTTYQCCEGFQRKENGCEQVDLKNIVDALDGLDSKDFATLLKSQDIVSSLEGHNFTVFAPSDEAMRRHDMDHQESNQISEGRRLSRRAVVEEWNDIPRVGRQQSQKKVRDMVMAHITNSLLETDDFTNEMTVKSDYQESPLRINIYPGRESVVMTVNCARLLSWDNLALHSRIHTVDRVLEPVTKSILEILDQPQFSQFKQYLERSGLLEVLANASAVTVFAPNNEAWDKLGDGLRDKYSRGEACIDKVLRHHVLPLTLCSAPTSEGRLSTADLDGELVRLSRQNGQLMVDDKGRVVRPDIVATNGVVHELDKVLTPKSAKPLSDLLLTSNHTTWLSLLDKAGLLEELNKRENITLFVPTERALREERTQELLSGMDRETLRRTLLNHVTQRTPSCDMRHKAELKTEAGNDLRVTMYNPYAMFTGIEPRAAVQCVPLGFTDGKACHVVAHEVTRLLLPPNGTALQLLSSNPQLSSLKSVMEGTQIEKDLEEKSELFEDGFTLLAPTDEAFNKLDEEVLSKLLTDKKYADEVIRMHILKEPVCCASITTVPWPFTNSVRTIDNKKIEVNRNRKDQVLFGNSATETCDIITTDGVMHIVDSVLLPQSSKLKLGNITFGTPDKRIMLFGI